MRAKHARQIRRGIEDARWMERHLRALMAAGYDMLVIRHHNIRMAQMVVRLKPRLQSEAYLRHADRWDFAVEWDRRWANR